MADLTCRSDYYRDTGRVQRTTDRSVLCELKAGHEGDHDELIDGEAGHVTWPRRPVEPRTWSLPPEPGPEVKAVRCLCCATTWTRIVRKPPHPDDFQPADLWVPSSEGALGARTWRVLVTDHSEPEYPLTDATADST